MSKYLNGYVIAKRQRFDMEYRIVRQNDKAEKWVHGIGECKFDKNGNILEMIGTIQDITERKNAEEEEKSLNRKLNERIEELERIQKLTINRELKMIELKKRINELETQIHSENSEKVKK